MENDLWVISLQVKASTKAPPKGSEDSAALKQEIKDLNARIQQLETEARRGSVVKGAGAETAADVSLWSKDQISTVFNADYSPKLHRKKGDILVLCHEYPGSM